MAEKYAAELAESQADVERLCQVVIDKSGQIGVLKGKLADAEARCLTVEDGKRLKADADSLQMLHDDPRYEWPLSRSRVREIKRFLEALAARTKEAT